MSINAVAPLAGAWIEISSISSGVMVYTSLPSRERGLKYEAIVPLVEYRLVAPLAGAWIEIPLPVIFLSFSQRRSPRGSVD